MNIRVKKGALTEYCAQAVVVPLFEGMTASDGTAKHLNEACHCAINDVIEYGDFEGKLNKTAIIYTIQYAPIKRIVLVGLGKKEDFNMEKLRGAFATAARQVRTLKAEVFSASLDVFFPHWPINQIAEAVVEGVLLGLYRFSAFKTLDHDNQNSLKKFVIVDDEECHVRAIRASVKIAQITSNAVCFARDMVSMPANEMTPTDMANKAREIVKKTNTRLRILDQSDMKKIGMNALLGVAKGSAEAAKFIILEYIGGKKHDPYIALVGKGLTFDSGGVSLKPADKMDEMKSDMAGGAAVLGAVMAACVLGLSVNVVGLIPATENMPGGKAYKPGDILTSLSGQTIEVVNTDAEGRLIMADALTYAGRFKPACIVDLATLTGACVTALGEHVIGMMGNDSRLKDKMRHAADMTGERIWELPLWEDYGELIKSDIADYKNSAGREGGAITAAIFLNKFVDKYPWIHLDIAGPAWLTKDMPYVPKGASGVGVRLIVQFLREWDQ